MGSHYTRYRPPIGFDGFTLTPAVKYLLLVNAALFVLPAIFNFSLYRALPVALVPAWVLHGALWQLFTYMFFHGGFSHFLFNMLTLWMFGTAVEQTWGTRRFATYYLACGLAAGITVVLMAVLSRNPEAMFSPTIGSSGAIFGLILAFGLLFPDVPVLMMFLFPIPAKYFAILMGFIEFFLQRTQPGSGISHIAHLGGMAFGLFYIKFWLARRPRTAHGYRPGGRFAGHPADFRSTAQSSGLDLQGRYNRWKLRRARKKFEVYMRQRESNESDRPGRWVN